jgi:hypothetical protein
LYGDSISRSACLLATRRRVTETKSRDCTLVHKRYSFRSEQLRHQHPRKHSVTPFLPLTYRGFCMSTPFTLFAMVVFTFLPTVFRPVAITARGEPRCSGTHHGTNRRLSKSCLYENCNMHAGIWRLKWSNIRIRKSKHDFYERIISRCSYVTQNSGCGWLQNWLETFCRVFTPCYLLMKVPQAICKRHV